MTNEKDLLMKTIENNKYIGAWDKETELYRITRKSDGLIGGYVEKLSNLSAYGNCFVYDNATVYDNAIVSGNAIVLGNTQISDGEITKTKDYITLKNRNSSGRYYTYNYTSDTWVIGCFIATTTELVSHLEEKANAIQKDEYTKAIKFVLSL